jgi:hypothetical protein
MGRKGKIAGLVVVGVIALGTIALAGGRPLSTPLFGSEERTATGAQAGDPDGVGNAVLTLNTGQEEVCWELSWENLQAPVTRAHIHEAPAGSNGGIVVSLFEAQSYPGTGSATGCDIGDATKDEIQRITKNPAAFYVNIHNGEHPGGAIRGQIEK